MAGQDNSAKVAAGASTIAAIAAALAYLNSKKVAAGELVFPDEVVQLIVALAASSEEIRTTVLAILQALGTGGGGGQGWPANTDAITSLRVAVAVTGTQLPFIAIPSGMSLVIKAWTLNPGWIQVGATQAECQNVNQSFPLLPNEVVTYQIENAEKIYIAGTVAGCFACLTVEQRRLGGG
jgi:hypothetical protein